MLLEYPKAQGIIQASWNWPFSRKDFEVYGEKGYAIATGGDNLRVRLPGAASGGDPRAAPRPPEERDCDFLSDRRGARQVASPAAFRRWRTTWS